MLLCPRPDSSTASTTVPWAWTPCLSSARVRSWTGRAIPRIVTPAAAKTMARVVVPSESKIPANRMAPTHTQRPRQHRRVPGTLRPLGAILTAAVGGAVRPSVGSPPQADKLHSVQAPLPRSIGRPVHAGYTPCRLAEDCNGHQRSPQDPRNRRSDFRRSRHQAPLQKAGQSSSLPTSTKGQVIDLAFCVAAGPWGHSGATYGRSAVLGSFAHLGRG